MEVQKEQTRLAKSRYTPYLAGAFDFQYSFSDSEVTLKLVNSGEGVAENLRLYIEAEARGDDHDFKIHTYENPMNRVEDDTGDLSILNPGEGRIEFRCNPAIGVSKGDSAPGYDSLDKMISYLTEEGVTSFRLGFYVRYEDQFGNQRDPFGEKYEVFIFERSSTYSKSVEDVFGSITGTAQ